VQKYFPFVTDDIVRAGVALAGGGACSVVGSCGAFSGGLMALSAKFSPRSDTLSPEELKQLARARNQFDRLRDWFIAEFGGIACRDVQLSVFGRVYNVMEDEELQQMREYQQALGKSCSEIAMKTAVKVAGILHPENSQEVR
jgi:hypothetical protein